MHHILRKLRHLNGAAGVALFIGPGLVMLGVDSWISHFAGKEPSHAAQWAPVVFSPIGAVLLLAMGAARSSPGMLRLGLRIVGAVAIVVGLAGTGYHLLPFIEDLQDESLTWSSITGALAIAPPVFAPLAFAAVGGLLCAVASPRVVVRIRSAARRTPALRVAASADVTEERPRRAA